MIGGGNYQEKTSMVMRAKRAHKTVVYGATELLTTEVFNAQLAEVTRREHAGRAKSRGSSSL